MCTRRVSVCMLIVLFFSPLILFAQVDFVSGNVRIVVDDYNGSIAVYRLVTPNEEISNASLNSSKGSASVGRYTGAPGTTFGAIPESMYLPPLENQSATAYWVSLLDVSRYTSNSAYYLYLNSDIYNLTKSSSITVKTNVDVTTNDVSVEYTLKDKAKVTVLMHVFSSSSDIECDSICVDVIMQNISQESCSMALKRVFDTYLGEKNGVHFSSAKQDVIDREVSFDSMDEDQWICSENTEAAVKFLFAGLNVSEPKKVIVANKKVFDPLVWSPIVKNGRRFDSLFSYDNSALAVIWKPVVLDFDSVAKVRYYVTTAEQNAEPVNLFNPSESESMNIDAMPEYSVDIEYVKKLFARIDVLEADPKNANPVEIEYLKQEVEKILQLLGQ